MDQDAAAETLSAAPYFGVAPGASEDQGVSTIRLFTNHREIAAVLDGLSIEAEEDLIALLQLGISIVSGNIKRNLDEGDGFRDTAEFAADTASQSARLPWAGKALGHLLECRDTCECDRARAEGYDAEVAEFFSGRLEGFSLSGEERDLLVEDVSVAISTAEPGSSEAEELAAILADTGGEPATGRGSILSSLPLPRLLEWLRRLNEPRRDSQDPDAQYHHRVMRDMWLRLRTEISEGPPSLQAVAA